MKTLILGGVKSGKSALATRLARNTGLSLKLIATATPGDAEMEQRIERHQRDRDDAWQTIEEPVALAHTLTKYDSSSHCLVVDCLTLWLTNLLVHKDTALLKREKQQMIDAVDNFEGNLIMVSNETSMGVVPLGELTRRYCDEAGTLHQAIASRCDTVILSVAGLPHYLKGSQAAP